VRVLPRRASRPLLAITVVVAFVAPLVPALAQTVPSVTLSIVNDPFSPNGDGILDAATAVIEVQAAATLTLEVLSPGGEVVRSVVAGEAIDAGSTRVAWRGLDDARDVVPDAVYTIRATVTDAAGSTATAEATTRVDTVPPRFAWRDIAPDPITGSADAVRLEFSTRATTIARLVIRDSTGAIVHRDEWTDLGGVVTETWDLRSSGGHRVAPGLYEATVTVRDAAGNVRTSRVEPIRDEHAVAARTVTSVEGAGRRVALTFDDCGSPSAWARILTVLEDAGVDGTFFWPGQRVVAEPALAKRTVAEGNAVGSHGWDHTDFTTLDDAGIARRLRRDDDAWWRTARAMAVPYVRPPYGATNDAVRRVAGSLGYGWIVLWDVDPRDWERPGASEIAGRVLSHIHAGAIVVMHVQDQTASALPTILRGLASRGLEQVRIDGLLKAARATRAGSVARRPV
jgi:peptidoglycan/xylan/chitin deacetylase (PgdA/CDA1 family)